MTLATGQCSSGKHWVQAFMWMFFDAQRWCVRAMSDPWCSNRYGSEVNTLSSSSHPSGSAHLLLDRLMTSTWMPEAKVRRLDSQQQHQQCNNVKCGGCILERDVPGYFCRAHTKTISINATDMRTIMFLCYPLQFKPAPVEHGLLDEKVAFRWWMDHSCFFEVLTASSWSYLYCCGPPYTKSDVQRMNKMRVWEELPPHTWSVFV